MFTGFLTPLLKREMNIANQYYRLKLVFFSMTFLFPSPKISQHCIHLHSENKWRGQPTVQLAMGVQKGGHVATLVA